MTASGPALRIAVALGALVQALAAAAQQGEAGSDAAALRPEQILLTMKKRYAACRSYRDTGVLRTAQIIEGGRSGAELPFATAFVRPNKFRFQFTDRGLGERSSVYVVWMDGAELRSWWDAKPGVREPESLQAALDAAAGITGGASIRIPGMLLPALVGAGAPLAAAERIDDGDDRGAACFRIKGKTRPTPYTTTMSGRQLTVRDETVTLWIDRVGYLLRKVEEVRVFDAYRAENTTTYFPEADVDVTPAQLAFGKPGAP
ncbi:MAG TPA: hypothetical protein VLW17_06940 [Thermoanaerobaculaceae bacterium]|nr:hypothetical protein [Thermoanaerobaculaceae bacterium]